MGGDENARYGRCAGPRDGLDTTTITFFLLAFFTLKSLWALSLFIYTRRTFLWLIIWDFIIFHVLFEGFGVICGDWDKPQEKRFLYYTSSYSFHKEGEK